MEKLTALDLEHLDTLVKSPVFGVLKKAIGIYREDEINQMITKPMSEVPEIRGRIQGLDMILEIPKIQAKLAEHLKTAKEAKEKAEQAKAARSLYKMMPKVSSR